MNQMAVICDDLTGAMEAGLQLWKKGFQVYVIIDYSFLEQQKENADAYVINTESRNVSSTIAACKIQEAWDKVYRAGFKLAYKKVDSTLRGNVGKELETILNHVEFDMILFAPALPFNGRTTKDGYHYINGKRLVESDLAKDPFSPIKDSYIPNIIKQQTAIPVEIVALEIVRKGQVFMEAYLEKLYSKGCRVAIIDAEDENDLEIISSVTEASGLKLLRCGSAGLFAKMNFCLEKDRNVLPNSYTHERSRKDKPVLILSGSPAKATKEQIMLAGMHGTELIRMNSYSSNTVSDMESIIKQVSSQAIVNLKEGKDVIIDGAGEGKDEIAVQYNGDGQALLSDSKKIQDNLSEIFMTVIGKCEISGVMVIGGDTLNTICRCIKAKAVRIADEVEPFIPVGIILQENGQEVPIVTKAGGFGSENVIMKAIQYLKGQI
ncbi:MAG: four-carbon acid sugar kinase family protein [Clostridia bacterium]